VRDYPSERVDLRSDTVTQPTPAMREVMAKAVVGDDVLGDDPTVIELQNRVAALLGKEAALFVPSGTMANALAIKSQTKPGDELIAHSKSHIYLYEGGGYAGISGCSIALLNGPRGIMSPADVKAAIRKAEGSQSHFPDCSLICVENTANMGGGSLYSQAAMDEICAIAHANDCRAHLDGARIFNAVVATGTEAARMARDFDSIAICLSKGLGAPVGSLLISDRATIDEAHRWRKMLGGGMRQAGILAAAGLYALDHNVERLANDHARALKLAKSVNAMEDFSVDLQAVQSNMVFVDTASGAAADLVKSLAEQGIDVLALTDSSIRAVIHLHITDEDIERTIAAFADV